MAIIIKWHVKFEKSGINHVRNAKNQRIQDYSTNFQRYVCNTKQDVFRTDLVRICSEIKVLEYALGMKSW